MNVYLYRALSGEILHHTNPNLNGVGGWGTLIGLTRIDVFDVETRMMLSEHNSEVIAQAVEEAKPKESQ